MKSGQIELFWIALFDDDQPVGFVNEALSQPAAEAFVGCYNRMHRSSERNARLRRHKIPASTRPMSAEVAT